MRVKTPFLVVNPKAYIHGQASLEMALELDKIAKDSEIPIYFTCPATDLRMIDEKTENIILTAQHVDSISPGRGMGKLTVEAIKEAGAVATVLNHAENPLLLFELSETIERCKEVGLITIVCADSVREARAIAMLKPDVILCEPTDLIGTGETADDSYIIETVKTLRAIDSEIAIMIASGITTAEDVYKVIYLGADGTGATSGILGAPDPILRAKEMKESVLEAIKDRRG